ncbi:cysteine--tRNA ligase [Allomesorhizobium alhagi]|jgi:cysteinyl-tRNA synthetase|uniref:Cysteine--tRNA ligase n=1 Tax=Mesorhizobium alhagi CCNWXJ12-2 TaxID=1107882 RepID=H0HQM6_9HYPH|nr:cysteine--tRNA ligase [Mesorhizobium alhagi]EHK56941.1 cysteinyl-tRNA synthetase [Mesorhizobium alhagi CCNWXJ12-2]
MADGQKGLKLYNTLTRAKEDFVPIDADNVRMYVCGPTVYDFAHIGNARPAIVFDVLFRLLRHLYGPDHVTYVRNITDVDDKINARAARDFPGLPLNEAIRRVTETTNNQYQKDVAALGCLEPTFQPRATDFVLPRPDGKADMMTLIQRLIERGHAYEAKGEILFDTSSMADYGQLAKRNLDEQQAGARVAVEAHKKNPQDFVLWKESSAEEPGWDASFTLPGGTAVTIRGRPGWHIECSAMSEAYLGEVFDIHGGGLDLIFPHHENELAQSRCAHGTEVMANYWMHNGFLQVEGRKMSKSEGNFVTINELLETEKFGGRKWPGEVLRLAMLMTHYREPIDFSVRKLEEAGAVLERWADAVQDTPAEFASSPTAGSKLDLVADDPLLDDINVPALVQQIHELAREAKTGNQAAKLVVRMYFDILGFEGIDRFSTRVRSSQSNIDAVVANKIEVAIATRLDFIREKNWAEADRIRDELLAQGIQLKDGKDPVTGERVTTWEVRR